MSYGSQKTSVDVNCPFRANETNTWESR